MRRSIVTLFLLAACAAPGTPDAEPTLSPGSTTPSTPTQTQAPPSSSQPPQPEPGTVPPAWLGNRALPLRPDGYGEVQPTPRELQRRRFTLPDTAEPLPGRGFRAVVDAVPPEVLSRSTWQPDCPVTPDELRYVRVAFWGFDGTRHTGELLLNASVADDLLSVFRTLYLARYPVEEMRVTRLDELDVAPTGDGNDTEVFVCRATVGASTFSQHAYGLAIDVNPFQNPYVKDDLVLPELASSYLDRDDREGVIHDDDVVMRAFASIGWEWGGNWRSLKDYQHFSENGR